MVAGVRKSYTCHHVNDPARNTGMNKTDQRSAKVYQGRSTFAQRLRGWLGIAESPDLNTTTEIFDLDSSHLRSLRLPPQISDRYKVLKVLGRGAFGIVLLARDLMIGRLISIKLLYRRQQSEDVYRQFLQEARIAGQIEHPNIVTIYDVVEDKRMVGIIMEYLPGGNLARMLELDGPLSEETALSFMCGIVDGLCSAHQMGVIHRDIKPPNILFDQNGTPIISDFGVASMPMDSGNAALELDADEAMRVVGTPEYMAPEQMIFGSTIDARADLYSCGLLLFEMLTGRRYYNFGKVRSIEEVAEKVQRLAPLTREDLPAEVSAATAELTIKLLSKSPGARYPDARSVLLGLETAKEALLNQSLIDTSAINAESSEVRRDMYQDILRLFLVDGVISPPERRELQKRAERLGVKLDNARELEEDVRQELGLPLLKHLLEFEAQVELQLSDGEFTDADRKLLRKAGKRHGITDQEQQKIIDRIMVKLHLNDD